MSEHKTALFVGAHPDDPDTSAGGTAAKLIKNGWRVVFLSMTDGCMGHYDMMPSELRERRMHEAERSGAVIGAKYEVWDICDGQLLPILENRHRLIRYIRELAPSLIVTNRTCDYHPDHRACAQLVQDASYLLTVPHICEDTSYMEGMPVIAFWGDDFMRPAPFIADLTVNIDEHIEQLIDMACCHESQYFEWMLWHGKKEQIAASKEQKRAGIDARFRQMCEGMAKGTSAKYAEQLEISEYGSAISEGLKRLLES